jgi:hypothetical protein
LEGIGRLEGVQPGVVEGFVGVDVADAGNDGLFEQEGFEGAGTAAETAGEHVGGEGVFEGFGAEAG